MKVCRIPLPWPPFQSFVKELTFARGRTEEEEEEEEEEGERKPSTRMTERNRLLGWLGVLPGTGTPEIFFTHEDITSIRTSVYTCAILLLQVCEEKTPLSFGIFKK